MKRALLTSLFFSIMLTGFSVQVAGELSSAEILRGERTFVTVKINKAGIVGIAKLIQNIPEGFRAVLIRNGGGKILRGEGGELKIVWLTLPVEDQVEVKYELIHLGKDTSASVTVEGSFSYVQNESIKELEVPSITLSVKEKLSASKEQLPVPDQKDEPLALKEVFIYKAQLGVYSQKKNISVFKNLPEVHFSKVNGLYKYYSGKFFNENKAREVVKLAKEKGFKGSFLVRVKKED